MTRLAVLLILALGGAAGCEKKSDAPKETVGADGKRRIPITAGPGGYKPGKVVAKPNEEIVLVFTRTVDGECLSQIKVGDGPLTDLPMNEPVEIRVTAPPSGEMRFACGMDGMQSGLIAVN